MMKKFVCQYAIVRFLPYRETGEFANVGIVMLCPEAGSFQFKFTRHFGRVTTFFEELDAGIYHRSVKDFKQELVRVQKLMTMRDIGMGAGVTRHLFSELTRTREALLRFDEVRSVLTDEPNLEFDKLFGIYVERNFATKVYQEELLEKHLKQVLVSADLASKYHPDTLGAGTAYHVHLPFVYKVGDRVTKAMKPLHLAHADPTKLFDHGWAWFGKLNKLRSMGALPDQVLLPVQIPDVANGDCYEMYQEISEKMTGIDIQVVPKQETQKIIEFAQV